MFLHEVSYFHVKNTLSLVKGGKPLCVWRNKSRRREIDTTWQTSLILSDNKLRLFSAAEKQQKEVWSSRLQKWLYERFGVYIEDFRFQPEESTVEAEEPLSAKRWVSAALE